MYLFVEGTKMEMLRFVRVKISKNLGELVIANSGICAMLSLICTWTQKKGLN